MDEEPMEPLLSMTSMIRRGRLASGASGTERQMWTWVPSRYASILMGGGADLVING